MVTNIINRNRPTRGSMKRPTLTVPDEHRQARQATVVIYKKTSYTNITFFEYLYIIRFKFGNLLTTSNTRTTPVGVLRCV